MAIASIPTGRVSYRFIPTQNFESEEVQTAYIEGMKYSVREGNKRLEQLVTQWVKAGLVKII